LNKSSQFLKTLRAKILFHIIGCNFAIGINNDLIIYFICRAPPEHENLRTTNGWKKESQQCVCVCLKYTQHPKASH